MQNHIHIPSNQCNVKSISLYAEKNDKMKQRKLYAAKSFHWNEIFGEFPLNSTKYQIKINYNLTIDRKLLFTWIFQVKDDQNLYGKKRFNVSSPFVMDDSIQTIFIDIYWANKIHTEAWKKKWSKSHSNDKQFEFSSRKQTWQCFLSFPRSCCRSLGHKSTAN